MACSTYSRKYPGKIWRRAAGSGTSHRDGARSWNASAITWLRVPASAAFARTTAVALLAAGLLRGVMPVFPGLLG